MTALKARIAAQIAALGPLTVSDYMATCLFDPADGYYTTRDPFGAAGDFVTAPEISQMFGELVGVWLASAWRAAGGPAPAMVVEIGPGRGTLMKDLLRTLAAIEPKLRATARFKLVEVSPRLAQVQAQTLSDAGDALDWHADIDELPDLPLFVVGNELFDAVPVRQYVKTEGGWRERVVDLDDDGGLRFAAGAGSLDPSLLPPAAADAPFGAVVEMAPARSALMQKIAARIARDGGAALFFDYGHVEPGVGDTLQAVLGHAYDPPLAHPGRADLTTHVDFAALAGVARRAGLQTGLATQGDFLLAMGIAERAGRLGADADEAGRAQIVADVERLVAPDAMGALFKVLAAAPALTALPGFGAED